jgi:hypothetical protein
MENINVQNLLDNGKIGFRVWRQLSSDQRSSILEQILDGLYDISILNGLAPQLRRRILPEDYLEIQTDFIESSSTKPHNRRRTINAPTNLSLFWTIMSSLSNIARIGFITYLCVTGSYIWTILPIMIIMLIMYILTMTINISFYWKHKEWKRRLIPLFHNVVIFEMIYSSSPPLKATIWLHILAIDVLQLMLCLSFALLYYEYSFYIFIFDIILTIISVLWILIYVYIFVFMKNKTQSHNTTTFIPIDPIRQEEPRNPFEFQGVIIQSAS